jgi:hypothetical protein
MVVPFSGKGNDTQKGVGPSFSLLEHRRPERIAVSYTSRLSMRRVPPRRAAANTTNPDS